MSGVKMGWVGGGFVAGLDLVKVFEFFETVLINGTDWFGEITVHLATADVEVGFIVMDDPGENGVLGQVVVGSIGCYVDEVQVLHIGDLPIGPHVNNISKLQLHDLLALFLQVSINHFPHSLLIEHKQQRVGVIIKPNLNTNLLEQEPISCDKLDFPVSEFDDLVVGTVD